MEATVAPEAETAIADIAQRHGLSREAVLAMLFALHAHGVSRLEQELPGRVLIGQLVAGRPRRSERGRRAERCALCGLPEHSAVGDSDQRRYKGFRHR